MNRREFMRESVPLLVFGGLTAGAAVAIQTKQSGAYEPCGLLRPNMPGSCDVDYVTLDGKKVEHVTALNDVEGWVEHLGPVVETDASGRRFRTYHAEGVVRVHWKAS